MGKVAANCSTEKEMHAKSWVAYFRRQIGTTEHLLEAILKMKN